MCKQIFENADAIHRDTTEERRAYLSRRVVTIDESGCTRVHPLSIVRICDGRLSITPFEHETAGVEYTDAVITCRQASGRWTMTFGS